MIGFEIIVSEPRPDKPLPPDPTYKNVNRPWGGLNVHTGKGCKFINLIIHDNSQGVSWWSGSTDSELYGCIIYNNGWQGTDRGHGHAIYTQNQTGTKFISNCIMTGGSGYTLHAYGSSRAFVDNYTVEQNIAYNGGTFLIGGGRPSKGIKVVSNILYNLSMQIGYSALTNYDCEVRNNLVLKGRINIKNFDKIISSDNIVAQNKSQFPNTRSVTYIFPNKYDSDRANITVINPVNNAKMELDLSSFLRSGESFSLYHPTNFFGEPVLKMKYNGGLIKLDNTDEFAVFVITRNIN